jgi:hypothetical protein
MAVNLAETPTWAADVSPALRLLGRPAAAHPRRRRPLRRGPLGVAILNRGNAWLEN